MATTIALLIALAVYTITIGGVNQYGASEGGEANFDVTSWNFDIQNAFNVIASNEALAEVMPIAPLQMVIAAIALILPSFLLFWIVRFIVK